MTTLASNRTRRSRRTSVSPRWPLRMASATSILGPSLRRSQAKSGPLDPGRPGADGPSEWLLPRHVEYCLPLSESTSLGRPRFSMATFPLKTAPKSQALSGLGTHRAISSWAGTFGVRARQVVRRSCGCGGRCASCPLLSAVAIWSGFPPLKLNNAFNSVIPAASTPQSRSHS